MLLLASLPYSRAMAAPAGCRCGARCRCGGGGGASAGEDYGADIAAPSGPPAGGPFDVTIPPADKPAAVRSQAAEVFRRAVWQAAGEDGWTQDAIAAWYAIATLPAMREITDSPGSATDPLRAWLTRAQGAIPKSWIAEGDPRGALALGALSAYGGRVLSGADAAGPLALYAIGLAWRTQAAEDKARGYLDTAAQAAQEGAAAAKDAIANVGPGFGFGLAIAAAAAVVAVGVVAAPEAAGMAVSRAQEGIARGYSKNRKRR